MTGAPATASGTIATTGTIVAAPSGSRDPFATALAFIWQADNDGAQNDAAPGEPFHTSWGVTQQTWDNAVAHGLVSGSLDQATQDQCKVIYRANYWNAMRCDSLPAGVAIMLFNDAVLTGVGHTVRMLQRIVGVTADGVVGPLTAAKVALYGAIGTVNALVQADEQYLATLAGAPKFLHGWTRREEECRAVALAA